MEKHETIKNTCYPNANFTVCVEDLEIGHLSYRLSPVKRWYPAPTKVTHYEAALDFGQGKSDMISLNIPDIPALDEILELLAGLRLHWTVAENKIKQEANNASKQ